MCDQGVKLQLNTADVDWLIKYTCLNTSVRTFQTNANKSTQTLALISVRSVCVCVDGPNMESLESLAEQLNVNGRGRRSSGRLIMHAH